MDKVFMLFKTLIILGAVGFSIFIYYNKEISPAEAETTMIKERWDASFLELNEAVILEIQDKKVYPELSEPLEENIGKEELFDDLDKKNYNF